MTDVPALYRLAVWAELAAVPVTLGVLLLVTAPYGRHRRPGWGPEIGSRWAWIPNYLGEIIEWAGWALATWSLAGLAFALFTVANLAPRAVANLRWYRETFEDYPARRKALIPGLL